MEDSPRKRQFVKKKKNILHFQISYNLFKWTKDDNSFIYFYYLNIIAKYPPTKHSGLNYHAQARSAVKNMVQNNPWDTIAWGNSKKFLRLLNDDGDLIHIPD